MDTIWLVLQRQFYTTFVPVSVYCLSSDACYFLLLAVIYWDLCECDATLHYQWGCRLVVQTPSLLCICRRLTLCTQLAMLIIRGIAIFTGFVQL